MIDSFMLYAMEQEGDLPTKLGKLNKFVKLLRRAADPFDEATQRKLFAQVNLDPSKLTRKDFEYINKKMNE